MRLNAASGVRRLASVLAGMQLLMVAAAAAQSPPASGGMTQERRPAGSGIEQPYVIEYYYQTRWGYADEFIRLYKKNHYPVLKKEMESGRILSIRAEAPRFHATEDRRWDYRVTIVFRNAQTASEPAPNAEATLKQLFPDQETFRREEQRRFEILLAHWDVPITAVDLTR
jgi:hypothetical protein